jgi:DNA-binding LacI/PurR family transcriptional regulator
MEDVARRANVSTATVSHVVNKTRYVSPETRLRVMTAIQELRYYKDAHARRLAIGQSDFFGLIVSDIVNPFFPELIKSFETAALDCGFDLMLSNTNYDPRRTQHAVRKMIENKVRGVAIMTSEFSPELTDELTANRVAVVFLDQGEIKPYTSCIQVKYSEGIYEAIHHLFELGHREIAFIAGPQTLRSAVTRRKAAEDALRQHGIEPTQTLEANHRAEGGISAVETLLKSGRFPTAILCSNDLMAIGAMSAIHEAGLRVPEDVSVVGFDDIYFARIARPSLTTVNLPRDRVGALALKALQRIIRSKKNTGSEYVVETHLVVRKSTGPAAR